MNTRSLTKALLIGTCLAGSAASLSACLTKPYLRAETASRIASPSWMNERKIQAAPFLITAYERMHERFEPATIYIEGDGLSWLTPSQPSLDPTPVNPLALHLAAQDKSKNVAYLARPCQYSKLLNNDRPCDNDYWTGKRYSREVVDSMNAAIDDIVRRFNIDGIHLVGFSGGGAIASILSTERDDVLTLRTVAGNLDHKTHSTYHEVSPLNGSLNAIDYVDQLRNIPQHHYIGGQDEIVPPAILHSYLQAMGESSCVDYTFVQEAEHESGWVDKWATFSKDLPSCSGPPTRTSFDFEELDKGFRMTPMKPSKP